MMLETQENLMGLLLVIVLFGGGIFTMYIIQKFYDYSRRYKKGDKSP